MGININNYEEYLLCYLDGELNADEVASVKQFLSQHPKLQREWKLLQATRISVEHDIIFPDKKSLYKQEAKPKGKMLLLRSYKWIAAAAACAALLVVFYVQFQKQTVPTQTVAVNKLTQPSDLKTKRAVPKSGTVSPALTLTKKKSGESQKENTNKMLAAGSHKKNETTQNLKRPVIKNNSLQPEENKEIAANNAPSQRVHPKLSSLRGARNERQSPPEWRSRAGNLITHQKIASSRPTHKSPKTGFAMTERQFGMHPSQLPSLPSLTITQEKPAIKASVAVISLDKEILSTNEATKQHAEKQKLLAKNISTKNISPTHKITHAATSFASAKEEIDSTITQRLIDFNEKTSGFINKIAKNGIKIGHITFAFNN